MATCAARGGLYLMIDLPRWADIRWSICRAMVGSPRRISGRKCRPWSHRLWRKCGTARSAAPRWIRRHHHHRERQQHRLLRASCAVRWWPESSSVAIGCLERPSFEGVQTCRTLCDAWGARESRSMPRTRARLLLCVVLFFALFVNECEILVYKFSGEFSSFPLDVWLCKVRKAKALSCEHS